MFERFTQDSRRTLFLARVVAQELGGNSIDPEHLLAGLLRASPASVSPDVQPESGVEAIRQRLLPRLRRPLAQPTLQEIVFSLTTQRVLNETAAEADRFGHRAIRPEHILLALFNEPALAAGQALLESGVDRQGIVDRLRSETDWSGPGQPTDARILTGAQGREIGEDWIRAWNSRDLDRILDHYAETVEFSAPTVITRYGESSGTLTGKRALREHFRRGLESFGPEVQFQLLDVLTGVNGYTIYYCREDGTTVIDTVVVDGSRKAVRVFSHYSVPGKPTPPAQ